MFRNFLLAFVALFVALDIIGTLPMYLAMTRELNDEQRKKVVDVSMFVAFIVAVIFAYLGEIIFRFIGIRLFDFKIAGGLVLLLVSLADLTGNPEAANRASGSTGIVPLAVPLITGPGVITTAILQVGTSGAIATMLALFVNFVLGWIFLRRSQNVTRLIGNDGTVVVSKIAALLLAAIAVAMIRSGVFEAIRVFRAGSL